VPWEQQCAEISAVTDFYPMYSFRVIFSLRILDWRVVRFTPSRTAAAFSRRFATALAKNSNDVSALPPGKGLIFRARNRNGLWSEFAERSSQHRTFAKNYRALDEILHSRTFPGQSHSCSASCVDEGMVVMFLSIWRESLCRK